MRENRTDTSAKMIGLTTSGPASVAAPSAAGDERGDRLSRRVAHGRRDRPDPVAVLAVFARIAQRPRGRRLARPRRPPDGDCGLHVTDRAAAELRHRIAERAEERLGRATLDTLGGLFVGTIHSYCFRLLQTRVPRYETYDVLDDHQLTAFSRP